MSNFSSLPLELVVGIIQLNEDDADLRALCAVCKTISAIAQPLLYHEINLVHGDSALSLFLLTRTIIHSPQIAAWIRCLKIDALTREKAQYGMCREDVDNFSIAVDRLGERYEVSEFLTTSNSQPAILAALLVSCTTNLAELTMHVNQNGVALLSALGQQPTVGYSCLSKIESLSLICSGEAARKDEVCFDSITPLFLLLPRLNRIWISGCFGHNNIRRANLRSSRPYKTPPLLLPQTLPITLVSFTQSYLTASNLRALISACKDLKDFSFTNRRPGKGRQQGQEQQFNPIDLYSALDCQKSNLEDLRVSLETDFISQAFDWDGCNYGSFRGCTQMKFLEVDERFLSLPPAGFPASLEYLVIHNCQSSVFELLSYLATLVSTGTELTSLKTISLYAHILFPGAMLGLPLKGASELLFRKAQQELTGLFLGTEVTLRFESGLLEKTVLGYEAASEDGYIGDYEPFVYIE